MASVLRVRVADATRSLLTGWQVLGRRRAGHSGNQRPVTARVRVFKELARPVKPDVEVGSYHHVGAITRSNATSRGEQQPGAVDPALGLPLPRRLRRQVPQRESGNERHHPVHSASGGAEGSGKSPSGPRAQGTSTKSPRKSRADAVSTR